MNTHLIVFAKAPEPGLAKTRLIPALGANRAAALAERMLAHAVGAATAADLGQVELCASPNTSHPSLQRLGLRHGLALSDQGEGDLGARMHRALTRTLRQYRRAILFGSDAPAIDAAMLQQAAAALATHDAVFVPALDGGYALVGLRRPVASLFEGIAWSTASVMAQTRERARAAGLTWAELAAVADIDEPGDLVHLPSGWLP